MKPLAVLAIALVTACGSAAKPSTPPANVAATDDAGLRIPFVPTMIGDRKTERVTMNMHGAFTVGTLTVTLTATKQLEKTFEVLEVAGGAATKVRVTYATAKSTESMNGTASDEPGIVPGKTYLVWAANGEIETSDDRGGAVSAVEAGALVEDWDHDLGKVPGMTKVLTGRAWTIGERVEMSPAELANLDMGDGETIATTAVVALASHVGEVATFDMDIVLEQKVHGGSLTVPSHVQLAVDVARSRELSMRMNGTLEGEVSGARATGTLAITGTMTYP